MYLTGARVVLLRNVTVGVALITLVMLTGACATGERVESSDFTLEIGDQIATAPPMLRSGMNFGNWMRVYPLMEEYERLEIPLLRYPAGNYGDENLLSENALERFVRYARDMDAEPMVQHNLIQGSPEEAARWVAWSRDNEMGIRYWFIGNEPDLYAPNRGEDEWTPEYYSEKFIEYADAIRAEDPDARLVGPVVTGTPNEEWMEVFLERAGGEVDVLAWQWYPTDGTAPVDEALSSAADVGEHIALFRDMAADPDINPDGYDRDIPMFISEFGTSWRSSHGRLLSDMTAALWLAEVWGEMTLAELEYAAYFALQATSNHGLFDRSEFVRPTYFSTLFAARMPDRWHEVTIDAARDELVAFAAVEPRDAVDGESVTLDDIQRGDTVRLMLINKLDEAVSLALPQAGGTIVTESVNDAEQETPDRGEWRDGVRIPAYSVSQASFEWR